jgi:predicted PhzF superfamily epimerase YddE/YHI9
MDGHDRQRFFLLTLLANERSVRDLNPELAALSELDCSAVIATAESDEGQGYDFVSRLFAPKVGIPEDPVTGSSHTVLAPFWAWRLGRTLLVAPEDSRRVAHKPTVEVRTRFSYPIATVSALAARAPHRALDELSGCAPL